MAEPPCPLQLPPRASPTPTPQEALRDTCQPRYIAVEKAPLRLGPARASTSPAQAVGHRIYRRRLRALLARHVRQTLCGLALGSRPARRSLPYERARQTG